MHFIGHPEDLGLGYS